MRGVRGRDIEIEAERERETRTYPEAGKRLSVERHGRISFSTGKVGDTLEEGRAILK